MAVFEVDGLDEAVTALGDAAGQRTRRRVGAALGQGADRIRDTARQLARSNGWSSDTVDTIQARRERSGEPTGYVFIEDAGFFWEVGTAHHPPNPVLLPALREHESAVVRAVTDAAGDL